jgi:hypothetical protein
MSADGNDVQQKKRARPGAEAEDYDNSDEDGEGLLETSTTTTSHPKTANTTRKLESAKYSRTITYEDVGRLDSQ